MNITDLENPYIKVTWEDDPESFTQERIKRVKQYFQKKYKSRNVVLVTKTQERSGDVLHINLEDNILDTKNQKELIKQFIDVNEIDVDVERVFSLDNKINEKLALKGERGRYRKIFLRKITFSNFLSFGDNNVIRFNDDGKITVIDSDPPNFGGKTVLAVDLILFLFFNTTTKSTKAEQIFNKFRNVNEVSVQGEITIDGDDFIIARKIIRKQTKKGDWTVKTELNFLQKLPDGSLRNFTGEQRRETEKFIKESIGNMDDFLLTVLSTGYNLEQLLESKPTERGNILSKFIGLEILKEKEILCKEIFSEWGKKRFSNLYNTTQLKSDINEHKIIVKETFNTETVLEEEKNNNKTEEQTASDKKLELLNKRHSDVDDELLKINPTLFKDEVKDLQTKLNVILEKNKFLNLTKPKSKFKEEDLKNKTNEILELRLKIGLSEQEIKTLNTQVKSLKESTTCPVCKRAFDDVNHEKEIEGLDNKIIELTKTTNSEKTQLETLENNVEELNQLKNEYHEYEKNKLVEEKTKLEIKNLENELDSKNNKLENWENNKTKLQENRTIETQLKSIESQIISIKAIYETILQKIQKNLLTREESNNKIKEKEEIVEKIKKEEEVERIFKIYLSIFGKNGISKVVLRSVIPRLNNELNRLLADSCYFMIDLRINDRNEIEFWMIDNESRVEKLLSAGSGYEKTIAALALRCVLARLSCLPKPNIVVFDEVFGKISNDNLELVGKFFIKVKEYFENVFLISHNPLVKEWADDTITVTKKSNISSIQNNYR